MPRKPERVAARPFRYNSDGELLCDSVSLRSLAARYGTPLYCYSAGQIRERLALFRRSFSRQEHLICYAVKANANLSLLRMIAREGAGFDIVSGGELERVRRADKRAVARTVFSGVGKTAEEMDLALRAGILLFNVESEQELELLAERAAKLRKKARVALRVNPDVFAETHPYISTGLREHKFGIDISRAREVYGRASKSKWLSPEGVSVHIGSQIRSASPFGAALTRVRMLVEELASDGIRIRSVDAGGGLGIDYAAPLGAEKFDAAQEVADYAAALTEGLRGLRVRLLLEPGRFLVAQAGALVARVLYRKRNGTKEFLITDAGMNDLIRPALYGAHHEIVPVERGDETSEETVTVDVVGPVCETGDFFARDRAMADVQPGALIALLDAGAYAMSIASNYNSRGRAAEVLVDGKRLKLARRRETIDDQLRFEE
ncbi:MAG TPA: diaminopimelate decarboxylase [Acidobacteriaceae bacterium]|nr:diaminopimelate decarboxylase [Acidobacteriaceae bacterium]